LPKTLLVTLIGYTEAYGSLRRIGLSSLEAVDDRNQTVTSAFTLWRWSGIMVALLISRMGPLGLQVVELLKGALN